MMKFTEDDNKKCFIIFVLTVNIYDLFIKIRAFLDLIQPEFTLGRALTCTFVMKTDIIKENIIKNVSKQHFVIRRDLS